MKNSTKQWYQMLPIFEIMVYFSHTMVGAAVLVMFLATDGYNGFFFVL